MVKIFQSYEEEPEDVFFDLPEELYCEFYALEMDNFTADLDFYKIFLSAGGNILELGCGTGRVSASLANEHCPAVGIDISLPMIKRARAKMHRFCIFLCMDMLALGLQKTFSTLIIPYNTLNLMVTKDKIQRCLSECYTILQDGGHLLLQLFIPTLEMRLEERTGFQFQLFDLEEGGKLVKEIKTRYFPAEQTVRLEERYRLRPFRGREHFRDYRQFIAIAGYDLETWLDLFTGSGFSITAMHGDYLGAPYDQMNSSQCLLCLKKERL